MEKIYKRELYINRIQPFIGKHHDSEIDFVAKKAQEIKYIQVAYLMPDEKVREREFENLLKISDNYEKVVVSADEFMGNYKGIKHMHINQFLTDS